MALAERTGTELREELHEVAEHPAAQLEAVAELAQAAAAAPNTSMDRFAQEARFDEVHKRTDAVTRELRAGVASLERHRRLLPAPYGERIARTLGRRLAEVEGQMAVTATLAERTGAELRDEPADVAAAGEFRRRSLAEEPRTLADRLDEVEEGRESDLESLTAGWRAELQALDVRLGDDLTALRAEIQKGTHLDPKTDPALRELIKRIEIVEGDRDTITAQLVRGAETWASERIALQERVAELAARIVTGPAVPQDGEEAVAVRARFDQLRINVEGLRMRLAYHEKAVSELSEARDVDDRIDDMNRLLGRLSTPVRRSEARSTWCSRSPSASRRAWTSACSSSNPPTRADPSRRRSGRTLDGARVARTAVGSAGSAELTVDPAGGLPPPAHGSRAISSESR